MNEFNSIENLVDGFRVNIRDDSVEERLVKLDLAGVEYYIDAARTLIFELGLLAARVQRLKKPDIASYKKRKDVITGYFSYRGLKEHNKTFSAKYRSFISLLK